MPVKTAKKSTKKATSKKVKEGDRYECTVCGLIVSVDEVCGCASPSSSSSLGSHVAGGLCLFLL